jgi:hypothetical protein
MGASSISVPTVWYSIGMKRSDKKYWFKRRRYGYGWTPVTWQGWLTVVVFLVVLLVAAIVLVGDAPRNSFSTEGAIFLAIVVALTALVMVISLAKGPKPKWRWGSRSDDDPDRDI